MRIWDKWRLQKKLLAFLFLLSVCFVAFFIFLSVSLIRQADIHAQKITDTVNITKAARRASTALNDGWFQLIKATSINDPSQLKALRTYWSNFQGDILEVDLFVKALTFGTESESFKTQFSGLDYKEWQRRGLDSQIIIHEVLGDFFTQRRIAKSFKAFSRHGNAAIRLRRLTLNEALLGKKPDVNRKKNISKELNLAKVAFERTLPSLNYLESDAELLITALAKNIKKSEIRTLLIVLTICFFALSTMILFAWFFLRNTVVAPIQKLLGLIHKMGDGDLRVRALVETTDEIGQFADSFNKMGERLQATTVSKEYIDNIVSSLPNALFIADNNGKIMSMNNSAFKLIKVPIDTPYEKGLSTILPLLKNCQHGNVANWLLGKFSTHSKEITLMDAMGKEIPILFCVSPLSENMDGVICVAQDISEMNALRKKMKSQELQMIHTGRLSSLGEMSAGIAHEINQPLAIMRTWMDIMKNKLSSGKLSPTEGENMLEKSLKQIDRATNIIEHMRTFARAGDEIKLEEVDLKSPVLSAYSMFKEQFRLNKIQVDTQFSEFMPKVTMNSLSFEQVVVNLLSNARHAVTSNAKAKGASFQKRIKLAIFEDKPSNAVVFEVSDNGAGMDQKTIERCLDPFFTTKSTKDGTGLGLSISHGIIQAMNGQIEVSSDPGKGSTFRIYLKA